MVCSTNDALPFPDVSLDQPVNAKGVNIKWEGVERAKYPVRMYPEIPNAQASMMTHPTRMIFDSDAHLYAAPDGKMAAGKYSFSFQYQLPLTCVIPVCLFNVFLLIPVHRQPP